MRLYVLDLGRIIMMGENPVTSQDEPAAAIPIDAFLVDTPTEKILFDTGCVPGCMQGVWPKELCKNPVVPPRSGSLVEQLAQLNIAPEEITCIVASHLHLDHAGGLHLFPNARVFVQEQELKHVMDDAAAGTLDMFHLACDVENWTRASVRWEPISGEPVKLCKDVTVLDFGAGHSFGMLGMLVRLTCGSFLLVSDAVYSAAHYGPPAKLSGAVEDQAGYFAAIEKIRNLSKAYNAQVLYGHDSEQFETLKKGPLEFYQ